MGKKRSRKVYLWVILVVMIVALAIITYTYLGMNNQNSGTGTQTRLPGVSLGDTFTYDVASFWISNNPNPVAPQDFLEINQTESYRVTITDISGSFVTTSNTWVFKNGTEFNSTGLVNVETGYNSGGFWPVVAANLGKNDILHPAGLNEITVDETIMKQYSSGTRETNHFTLNYQDNDEDYGYYTAKGDYYFDKATGMLVELYDKSEFLNANMQCAILWKIKESNVWVV